MQDSFQDRGDAIRHLAETQVSQMNAIDGRVILFQASHDSRPSIGLSLPGTGERSGVAVAQKGADRRFLEHIDQSACQELIHR